MAKDAKYWIEKLQLLPHPEGGFYAETFRSNVTVNGGWGDRSALTSIFYLLEGADFSGFHRIQSPELWYFHHGSTLLIHEIDEDGVLISHVLNEDNPFAAIKPRSWFASEVQNQSGFVLVSCAVAPGFDFQDFEMAEKETLTNLFPTHKTLISRLAK